MNTVGVFDRLKKGLFKTRKSLIEDTEALARGRKVDDHLLEEFEELLIMSDVGPQASAAISDALREKVKQERIRDERDLKEAFREEVRKILKEGHKVMCAGEKP